MKRIYCSGNRGYRRHVGRLVLPQQDSFANLKCDLFLLHDWVVTKVFGEYNNNEPYPESLDNLTPADVYFGRKEEVLSRLEKIKEQTLWLRRKQNLQSVRV